jgi:hypothetical protein
VAQNKSLLLDAPGYSAWEGLAAQSKFAGTMASHFSPSRADIPVCREKWCRIPFDTYYPDFANTQFPPNTEDALPIVSIRWMDDPIAHFHIETDFHDDHRAT